MPTYELTYIVRPLEEANLSAVNERVANLITAAGGAIIARNDWGKRRFAYPIRKLNEGFYVALQVSLPPPAVRGVERALQLNDDILRYLVVRADAHATVRSEAERS